jgi:hypothetical protein
MKNRPARAQRGRVPGEPSAEPGFAAGYVGQLDKAVAVWSDPAAWQWDLNVMGTPTPAADVAALLIAEMVLHGRDPVPAPGSASVLDQALALSGRDPGLVPIG